MAALAGRRPLRVVDARRPFLARMVTNLCLNALTSARARREVYVGPWLPEPVLTGTAHGDLGPARRRRPAGERLVRSPGAPGAAVARRAGRLRAPRGIRVQLPRGRRADRHHGGQRPPAALPGTAARDRERSRGRSAPRSGTDLIARFLVAARDGDVAGLEALLAADVVSRADGGGIVNAARRPVQGRENVARYVAGLVRRFQDGAVPMFVEVNGAPAVALIDGGDVARRPGAAHRRRAPDRPRLGGEPGEARLRRAPAVTNRGACPV